MFVQQLLNGFIMGNTYVLVALGFTLVFGIVDIHNFAHGELYMVGAFAVFFFYKIFNIPFALSIFLGMIITGFVGVLFYLVGFRPLRKAPPVATLISSVALMLLASDGALLAFGADPKYFTTSYADKILRFGGLTLSLQRLLIVIVAVGLVLLLNLFIRRTRMGMAMRACAQNRQAAGWCGINFDLISSVTFGISGALAAAAGGLMVPMTGAEPTMGMGALLKAFAVVILGGMGNVPGAIVGGYIIGFSEALTVATIGATYKNVAPFAIILLVLIIKPSGIFGQKSSVKL